MIDNNVYRKKRSVLVRGSVIAGSRRSFSSVCVYVGACTDDSRAWHTLRTYPRSSSIPQEFKNSVGQLPLPWHVKRPGQSYSHSPEIVRGGVLCCPRFSSGLSVCLLSCSRDLETIWPRHTGLTRPGLGVILRQALQRFRFGEM